MYCYCQLLLKRFVRGGLRVYSCAFLCILYSLFDTVYSLFDTVYSCVFLCIPVYPIFPIRYCIPYSLLDHISLVGMRHCIQMLCCYCVLLCLLLQDCIAKLYSITCCTRLPCDLQYLYTSHIIEIMCNVLLSK